MTKKAHRKSKYLLSVLLFSFLFLNLKAQTLLVHGKIVDSTTQQPVSGATVSSGKQKVLSDANGSFTINADKGSALSVSFIGYGTRSVAVNDEGSLNITLSSASQQLTDVVVTALGVRKEVRRVGYAVQQVQGEDLVRARDANPVTGLQGKVAGLSVGPSAELLRKPTVLLRGNEITLYVIDGVPVSSDTWNISPDDIETYTILKGPTAAALYGSRAQYGAILITTKKGLKHAGFTVEFNSTNSIDKGFLAFPRLQNDYGPGENELYAFGDGKGGGLNDNDYDVWGPKFEGQPIPQFDGRYDPNQTFTTTFPGGYVFKGNIEPTPFIARGVNNLSNFLRAGFQTTNNIALNATGDKYNLRFSLSQSYQQSIIPNMQLNITNFNMYGSYKLNNRLTVSANINFNRQYTPNFPDVDYGPNSLIYNIAVWTGADWDVNDPLIRGIWQPGKVGTQSVFAEYQRYHNPWFVVKEWLRGHYKTDINGYVSANYKINNHLNVTPRTQITTYNLLRTEKMPFSAHPYGREGNMGDYREDRRDLFESNSDLQLNYNYDVAGFVNLSGLIGGSARIFKYNSSWTSTDYLTIPELYTFSNSLNAVQASSFSSSMRVLSAYYSLDATIGKYATVSVTGRVDKSSALPPSHNSYFYPSVSIAAPLSDYINLPEAISFLKLRASYATVHSDATSATIGVAPFNTITAFGESPSGNSLFDYPLGYGNNYESPYGGPNYALTSNYSTSKPYNNITAAYSPSYLIDPGIKPLNRVNYEGGFDINFLHNRLGLNATAFMYIDGPQILPNSVSTSSGYSVYYINALKTKKTGLELSLTGTPVKTKDIKWDVLVNWSTFRDVFDELPPGQTTYATYNDPFGKVGDRVDRFFGSAFVKTTDGKVVYDASGYPLRNPAPQFLGYLNAKFRWGIYNKVTYKQFFIGFQFDGSVGGVTTDYMHLKTMQGGRNIETIQGAFGVAREQDNQHAGDPNWNGAYVADGVVVSNNVPINFDSETGAILNYGDLKFANNTQTAKVQQFISSYYGASEPNIMSKTFASLREVTLGYSIPQSVLKNGFISKIDITLVARNLIYFYKDPRFKDVDLNQYNYATTSTVLQTPTTRRYGLNLNIVF